VRKSAGLILIEMIIAVAVAGIAAVAVLEILTSSVRAGRHSENIQTATNLCRERLEQIRNIPALSAGTGANATGPFLPDLNGVSVDAYFTGFYLTESDTYQASDGTPGSLIAMTPPGRVDRITRIEWVDDAGGGSAQDYFKVTVTVYWQRSGKTESVSLETIVSP